MVRTVTVSSISLLLQTDVTSLNKPNASGILHGSNGNDVFCWIVDSTHLRKAVDHFKDFDPDEFVFIPYSNRANWNARHPYAEVLYECTADGEIVDLSGPRKYKKTPTQKSKEEAAKARKKQRCSGLEMLPSSILSNSQRDVLHVEIYKYLTWLKTALSEMEVMFTGKKTYGTPCAKSVKVQECLDAVKGAFRVVATNFNEDNIDVGTSPLLESGLGEQLEQLVVKLPLRGGSHKREFGDFENYWQRLMDFREKEGHSNVPVRYKEDMKLGKWVSNIRQKRKHLEAKGLTCEEEKEGLNKNNEQPSDPNQEDANPKPSKRGRGRASFIGAATLTKERIERFESINFAWDLSGPTPRQSWETRFEQMMEYYREHGKWPTHSQGTLGEWVHKQRCKWAKKDPVFMQKHFEKLEEVGFLWRVKEKRTVPWEARLQQLIEFGRLNGHFHVPDPDTDEIPEDEANAEATRFYKWVHSLHAEYEAFKNGEGSEVLNDARVLQLVKLGFQFGGGIDVGL